MTKYSVHGSKGGCFPPYALVSTKNGPVKIVDISVGDEVVCYDVTGKLRYGTVTDKVKHPADSVYRVYFWGGFFDVTSNHWVLNQYNTFVPVGSLQIDDALVNADGHLVPVENIEYLEESEVFNITVSPYHTFICEGIRVHNGGLGIGRHQEFIQGNKGGSKGGGGSTYTPKESPNTLRSKTVARVLDLVSEGEIGGLVDGTKSIYLDGTPVQNVNGTYNFTGVEVTERVGTPDQDYIPNFSTAESEFAVGVEVLKATPVVRTITDENATACIVKIRIPSLTKQTSKGDLNGASVAFTIARQSDGGGYTTIKTETVSGKTTSPYEISYRIPLDAGGHPWDIKVTRTSDDDTDDATLTNSTYWSTYTKVIDTKLQYNDSAIYGVEVDAEQFGDAIPKRAYEIYGILLKVPSNYTPATRTYTGIWDGTFQTAWSDNPAWVLYDLMTNNRYGLGSSIAASQIDKFALYGIAQYCDDLVPDGNGGYEPRYTFNYAINTREEAYKVLNSIASVFRGMLYWYTGLVSASIDKPQDSVSLLTPANVIDGVFTYSGSSLKTKYSVFIGRYINPDESYANGIAAHEDPTLLARLGWKPKNVICYGCTSRGQALRHVKWLAETEKSEAETVTYKTGFDNADVYPGELVDIADPTYAGVRYGGRISAVTSTTVTLDQGVVLSSGETYTIACVLADGTIVEKTVNNTPDDETHTDIEVAEAFDVLPLAGAVWMITGSDVSPRTFRIINKVEVEKNIYEFTGVYHDSTKYARIEQNIYIDEPSFTALPTGDLAAPKSISRQEYLYTATGGIIKNGVLVSWSPSTDPRVAYYDLEVKRPDVTFWESTGVNSNVSRDITDIIPGIHIFRVRGLDRYGRTSSWSSEASFLLLGLGADPSDVENFRINNAGDTSILSWDHVTDLDLAYYIVKHSSKTSGAVWEEATIIDARVAAGASSTVVPTLVGTYLIKAVDSSGNESVDAALIINRISDLSQTNVEETITEHTAFDGVLSNAVVESDVLKLDDPSSVGYYYFTKTLDLGDVYTSRVIPDKTAYGEDTANTMDTWTTLSGLAVMSTASPGDWKTTTQVRITDDAPWYSDSTLVDPEDLTSGWTADNSTVTAGYTMSPDGYDSANRIVEDGAAGEHGVYTANGLAPDTEQVFAVWAKAGARSFIRVTLADAASATDNVQAVFNLSTGVVSSFNNNGNGTGVAASIVDFGNGWHRCILSGTPNTSGADTAINIHTGTDASTFSYTGNGAADVLLWGADSLAGTTPNTPTWVDWSAVILGKYTCRAYQFREYMQSLNGNTKPVISELQVTVDMPDRIERGDDIVVPVAGKAVTYSSAFRVSPAVNITLQDAASDDKIEFTTKDATGFTFKVYNTTAAGYVERTFDYISSGYGRRQ